MSDGVGAETRGGSVEWHDTTELLDLAWLYGIRALQLSPIGELKQGKFGSVQASEIVETAEFFRPHSVILTLGLRIDPFDEQAIGCLLYTSPSPRDS